jgi:hypothetical protein
LTADVQDAPDVADDVRRLATEPVPIAAWPAAVGWADDERRFALRHHAGRLRVLEDMLGRGLCLGLLLGPQPVGDSVLRAWAAEVRTRRLECVDALVGLRVDGRVRWSSEPPTWDRLWHAWHQLLASPSLPRGPRTLLRSAAETVAGVAATTTWCAAWRGEAAAQSFTLAVPPPATAIEVHAIPPGGPAPEAAAERCVVLALVGGTGGDASVRISWRGSDDAGAPEGTADVPAPDVLAQPAARRSSASSSGVQSP